VATTDSPSGARNTDYAQALALAGLLAGASLSLSRLYAGNAWLLPTWLTMGAALGLAALLRRLGVGQLLSLLAMAVGFVVVGGILLFPGTLLVVVPTGRTLTEMAAAASAALTAVGRPGSCCSRAGPGWPPGAAGCRAPAAGPAPAGGCR